MEVGGRPDHLGQTDYVQRNLFGQYDFRLNYSVQRLN